ncbi:MAG: hypothetical protein HYW86_05325 [Candidatus Roizmanbacteria bacterium]|nr:MAG: hypothetical protein HYW86_05325 [Candidatus Roizmanbacteria bacterium]
MSLPGKEAKTFDRFFLGKVLNLHVNRKEFLVYGGVGLIGTALLARTAFGSNPPSLGEGDSYKEKESAFKPGWIEENIKADFINPDPEQRGHINFLREAIFNNPVLFDSTVEYFKYLNDKASKNERLKLGDMFAQAHKLVSGKLEGASPIEKMHAAAYVFTAGLNPWLSEDEMLQLGVDVAGRGVGGYFWGKDGIGNKVFPKVLGNGRDDLDKKLIEKGHAPRYGGQDRAVHFAHHFLLTFIYLYSENYHLKIHERIPEILKYTINAAGFRSKESRAVIFSYVIGQLFEFSALRDFKYWRIPFIKEDVNEGRFEDMADKDIEANALGAKSAIKTFGEIIKEESPEEFFKTLNEIGE